MQPDSQDPKRISRTERRDQPADVIRFKPADGEYLPSEHNLYDDYDAIETEDYNPYEDGDIIDPDAPDDEGTSAEVLQMPRMQAQSSENPRKIVQRAVPEVASYGDYEDDRGGYPLGMNTPVASYDEPAYEAQAGGPGDGGPGGKRPRRPKKERRFRHRGLVIVLIVLAALVGIYHLVFGPIDSKLAFDDTEGSGLSQELSWHLPGTPYYVLLLGSDAREGDTVSRTDTMMLARIDPIESKVTLVSIPRDTMVQIEGQGTQKINAAYAFGGAAGAVKAVSDLTGASIAHVAVVKFDGVSNIVDYLGGVTVNVPVAVNDPYYTGLVLPAGEQTMDGNTAMLFSRVRHGFANGDYQRQEDQRILLQAILNKCLSLAPSQIPGLVDAASGLVSTDMHCSSILPLLLRFVITSPTVYSCSIQGTSQMVGGVSYEVVDSSEVRTIMARVDAGDDPSTDSATVAQQSIG